MADMIEKLSTILIKATGRVFGADASGEVYYDELSFDEIFGMTTVETEVTVLGKNVNMSLTGLSRAEFTFCSDHKGEDSYHLNVNLGACNDVVAANLAMNAYERSEIGQVLEIENEVDEGDILLLTATFAGASDDEAVDKLADVLWYIVDEEKGKPFFELLKYFD